MPRFDGELYCMWCNKKASIVAKVILCGACDKKRRLVREFGSLPKGVDNE